MADDDRVRRLEAKVSKFLKKRRARAKARAKTRRAKKSTLRRRLQQLESAADSALRNRDRIQFRATSRSLHTVTLRVWLRYQDKDGDFTTTTPVNARRGAAGRAIKRDGADYVYTCKKDNLVANVHASALAGVVLGQLYWNPDAYDTFVDADGEVPDDVHALSEISDITSEPTVASFLERLESSVYIAIEVTGIGPVMHVTDGAGLAARRMDAPFGDTGRLRYRDSPHAALSTVDLATALKTRDALTTEPRRCGPELLIRKYGDAIRKVAARLQWRRDFTPTFDWFWTFFGRAGAYDGGDFLLTPRELRTFCETFRIPLTVINGLSRPVPEACYDPPAGPTGRISRQFARLCAQIVDGHLFDLNHRTVALYNRARAVLRSWADEDADTDSVDVELDAVGDEDQLPINFEDASVLFARDGAVVPVWLDDVPDELPRVRWDEMPSGDVYFQTDQSTDDILAAFAAAGIVPSIGLAGARVSRISLRVSFVPSSDGDKPKKEVVRRVHISPPKAPRGELLPDVTGRLEVEHTAHHRAQLRNILCQQPTASLYAGGQSGYDRETRGPQVAHIFREFPTAAVCTRFPSAEPLVERNAPITTLDQCKAHTSVLAEISDALPVFYTADEFVPYDGGEIDGHSWYLVRQLSTVRARSLPVDAPLRLLLDRPDNLVRGVNLRAAQADPAWEGRYDIEWVARPSRLVNVRDALHNALRDLYNDATVSATTRKFVVNCIVGELGTKVAFRTANYTFATYEEAAAHAHELGLMDTGDLFANAVKAVGTYFVVTQETRVPLRDGRLPIHLAVLQEVRLRNYRKAVELVAGGCRLLGVKTDCLFVTGAVPHVDAADITIDDILKRGGAWRTDSANARIMPPPARAPTTLPDMTPHTLSRPVREVTLTSAQEYDADVLASLFKGQSWYITSTVPGAGKSTAILNYCATRADKGEPYLVVTPMNKLAADYRSRGIPAQSLHSFLGLGVSDSKTGQMLVKTASADDNETVTTLRHLVVDEIFTAPELVRVMLREWELRHPAVIVYRVGDTRQLPSIEYNVRPCTDDADMRRVEEALLKECPRKLTLRVCKRVTSPGDRDLVYKLFSIFWDAPWTPATRRLAVEALGPGKVLQRVDEIPDNAAVVSFHVSTAEALAYELACRTRPDDAVFVGTLERGGRAPLWIWKESILRCYSNARLGRAVASPRLVNNGRYTVTAINVRKREAVIVLDGEDEPVRIGWAGLCKWFGYGAHAATGHSWQGATIRGRPLVLADIDSPFVTRRWLWMSLTRGDDMTAVYVFQPAASEEAKYGFGARTWKRYMQQHINAYKAQDAKAGRRYDASAFVTVDGWLELMHACGAACVHCGQLTSMDGDDTSATLDRIVGSVAHLQTNVQVACASCNRARH